MKTFFKDLWDLQKHSNEFLKDHWKGYLVLGAVIFAGEVAYFYKDDIVDAVKEKLLKKGEAN